MIFLDAISSNLNFPKPRRDEFEDAMIKALKSTKERFRRQQKRPRYEENDEHRELFLNRTRIQNERKRDDTRKGQFIHSDDAQQPLDDDDQDDDQEYSNLSDVIDQSIDYNPTYNDDSD